MGSFSNKGDSVGQDNIQGLFRNSTFFSLISANLRINLGNKKEGDRGMVRMWIRM